MNQAAQILSKLNLRKTQMREQILNLFLDAENKALSNREIEVQLENPDRITLYRTLKTFESKGLIHVALDGSGTTKYALCSDDCSPDQHDHDHAHFHCTQCGDTLCVENYSKIKINLPEGYILEDSHIILEGICVKCNPKYSQSSN